MPRAVTFRDGVGWVVGSCRLVVRKPHYWIACAVLLFAWAGPVSFVPVAGNYLRSFLGGLWGAFLLTLTHTQVSEGKISLRRALSLLAPALPTLLWLCAVPVAIFAFVDLPILRIIATDREFEVYALSRLHNGHPRFVVDLVHTVVLTLACLPFEFAVPLAIFGGCSAYAALRKSIEAFALSPAVYVALVIVGVVVPHSLATAFGMGGVALFLIVVTLLLPAQYLMFRSAFAEVSAPSDASTTLPPRPPPPEAAPS
ncbi:MAG: hypothetical protein ACXWBQ_16660 [Usitatibacter sp.]